jgi:phosphodiesterase/alkaline phosphatase D-like protein
MKVRVLSGYHSRHWGLGEIEVFGSGARMLPDDDLYHVNQDVWDLRPGATIHYRLVATGAEGVARGETRSFTLSPDRRPHVRALEPLRSTPATARLQGRLSPMGLLTYYHFEYGPDPGLGSRTPLRYAGAEITPRSIFTDLDGLQPRTRYHYRLVGINEEGVVRSETVSFLTR